MRATLIALGFVCLVPPIAHAQIPGMALSLDGNDQFVCTNRTIFSQEQTTELTISAWMRFPVGAIGGTIAGNHENGTAWESVELFPHTFIVNSSNSFSTRQRVEFSGLDDNQWHHLAGVWDGAEMRVYVDGALYAGPVAAPLGPWASSRAFTIGGRISLAVPPISSEFEGWIDEVRVWNVARTQQQISSTMNTVLGPQYTASADSGLCVYFRFDNLVDQGFKALGLNDVVDLSFTGGVGDLIGDLVSTEPTAAPASRSGFSLRTYPNPFRNNVEIWYAMPQPTNIELSIFTVSGRKVATLEDNVIGPEQRLIWDGRDQWGNPLGRGVYLLGWRTGSGLSGTRKLVIAR